MKKLLVLACATATLSLAAGPATADNINGRVGVTGKIGFTIPADSELNSRNNHTDPGFIGGGGLIYGIDNYLAAEVAITSVSYTHLRAHETDSYLVCRLLL